MTKYRVLSLPAYAHSCACLCALSCLRRHFTNSHLTSLDDKVLNEARSHDLYPRGMIPNCRKIVNGIVFLCFEVIEVACGAEGDWCHREARIVRSCCKTGGGWSCRDAQMYLSQ